jgi:hypothetical protein
MNRPAKINFVDLSDDDLDQLAEITEADILDAHGRIVVATDPEFKNIVVSTEETPLDASDPESSG